MKDLVTTAIVTLGAIMTGYFAFSGKREDTKQNTDEQVGEMFKTQSSLVSQLSEQVTALTSEIVALRAENNQLKAENEKLRNSVDELTARVSALTKL
jgi:peptidoglycan hydrolase CwlO-like protein